jgi:DNA-binding PadR family transcriptional regulator
VAGTCPGKVPATYWRFCNSVHFGLKPAVLHLLVSLAAGDKDGYALRKDVAARSGGNMRLGPATLYRTLAQMLEEGTIEESGRRPAPELDDERRRYYRLTDRGRRLLDAEVTRLEQLAAAARAVILQRGKA